MVNEGQEFLRSKMGFNNTYDKGDAVNALRWTDRDRPLAREVMTFYRGMMHLRKSDAGRSFRVKTKPPHHYYRWIDHPDNRVLGYIVNAPRIHPGNGFIVVINAGMERQTVTVDLPAGNWKLISDGSEVKLDGIEGQDTLVGPRRINVTVPDIRSLIFMDGF